jgi:hypothetical protein
MPVDGAFRLDWLTVTFGYPRVGVQSMVTASFGGVLVRTPLVANAFAAAMAQLRSLAQHLLHRLDTGP